MKPEFPQTTGINQEPQNSPEIPSVDHSTLYRFLNKRHAKRAFYVMLLRSSVLFLIMGRAGQCTCVLHNVCIEADGRTFEM